MLAIAAYKRAVLKVERAKGACVWTLDDDGDWQTACGQHFCLNAGTPTGNGMQFCYHCGKPLAERERGTT